MAAARRYLRAQWILLRGRREFWLLVIAIPSTSAFLYLSGAIAHAQPLDSSLDWPPEFVTMHQLARERDAFPQSVLSLLDSAAWVAWASAVLGALLVGSEFGWATIRTTLVTAGRLEGFFLAKVTSVLVIAAVLLAALVTLGSVLPAVAAVIGVAMVTASPVDWVGAAAYAGAWFVSAAVFGAIGLAFGTLSRSPVLGLIVTLVYITGENIVAQLPMWAPTGRPEGLVLLLPVQSTIQLVRHAATLAGRVDLGAALPEAPPFGVTSSSLLVPFAWVIGLVTVAVVVGARRDIAE
ncbi:MAG: hypothetical protein V4515_14030 [Chloroflexota bacterium]